MKGFADTYVYSKRMAESVLIETNDVRAAARGQAPIPLLIIRPTIVSASHCEPMPGWTDTQGILSGVTLAVGMGVMKHMPGNQEAFIDIIPVDFVSR